VALPVEYLRCPLCSRDLLTVEGAVRCPAGHSFDVARQGYVDLSGGRRVAGDTAAMIAAREAFLGAGHFSAIADAVSAETAAIPGGCVVEAGAGTGYYLARARGDRAAIALDSSRYAARRAARAGLGAVVCDVWRAWPVRDGVASAVLCVFAPRNAAEMRRVLASGGVIVVVTPTPRHLAELVEPLGLVRVDERKPERLAAALGEPVRERELSAQLRLSRDDVAALIGMGPSAHHVDAERVARPATATLSVRVAVYE
jgi:SAM-dependent methyltransferase